jgi:hypothetical protein
MLQYALFRVALSLKVGQVGAVKGSTNLNLTPEGVFADKNLKSRIDQLLTTAQPGKEHIVTSLLGSLDPV